MNRRLMRIGATFAVAVLVFGPVIAYAQESNQGDAAKTLTGQLTLDDEGTFYLVEQESGSEIRLKATEDLNAHVDTTVKVTGQWSEDDYGEYFEVWSIEPTSDQSDSDTARS